MRRLAVEQLDETELARCDCRWLRRGKRAKGGYPLKDVMGYFPAYSNFGGRARSRHNHLHGRQGQIPDPETNTTRQKQQAVKRLPLLV